MKNKMKYILPAVAVVLIAVFAFAAPFSNFYGKQTVRLYNELNFMNTSGTSKFALANDGTITVTGTAIAVRDSFLTTASIDTVPMTGATTSDIFVISMFTPAWSSTPDTNVTYSIKWLNTDTLLAQRYLNVAGADFKSGGQFHIVKVDK